MIRFQANLISNNSEKYFQDLNTTFTRVFSVTFMRGENRANDEDDDGRDAIKG